MPVELSLAEARGTHLLLNVPESLPPILGDRRRVEQILTNLLGLSSDHIAHLTADGVIYQGPG